MTLAIHLLPIISLLMPAVTAYGLSSLPCRLLISRNPSRHGRSGTTSIIMGSQSSLTSTEDSPQVIRWGIVGLGDVTATKSGPAFYKCQGSELTAVMRRTPGAAEAWIESQRSSETKSLGRKGMLDPSSTDDIFRNIRPYDDIDVMLRNGTNAKNGDEIERATNPLDVVYVATPPGAHLSIARKIAQSGVAAYIEKPVGRCAWETRAIADEFATKEGTQGLFTAYVSRAHERTMVVRKLLCEEKACGDRVTAIRYRMRGSSFARGLENAKGSLPWRLDASQSGGGLIMDVGCHVLDRIDYLFGPIINVKGTAKRKSINPLQMVEDYVDLSGIIGPSDWDVIPSEGATVECTWDFCPDPNDDSESDVDDLIIEGPGGSLRMGAMGAGLPVRVHSSDGAFVKELTYEAPAHAAQPMIQAVTDELLQRKLADGEDGREQQGVLKAPSRGDNAVRTSEVLDAALNHYYGGRHDEFWSRPETWPGIKEATNQVDVEKK